MTDTPSGRRAWIAASILSATLISLYGCGATEDPAGPEELPPPKGLCCLSHDFLDTLSFEGYDRISQVHLPPGYDHETRLPLLLVFHGAGTWYGAMREWTGFDAAADAGGFVVVYPGAHGSWSDRDVGFVRELVNHLTVQWAVDPSRVALTGFSAGGILSHRLACESGFHVRAVATVGATVRTATRDVCDPPGPERAAPVSALVMLGDSDTSVPVEGTDEALSLAESVALWRTIDGCSGSPAVEFWPAESSVPHVRTEVYSACTAGTEVRGALMVGLGHVWPRPDSNPSSIDATAIVTEFVSRQW